jgi:pentatricopeptide repeat protein
MKKGNIKKTEKPKTYGKNEDGRFSLTNYANWLKNSQENEQDQSQETDKDKQLVDELENAKNLGQLYNIIEDELWDKSLITSGYVLDTIIGKLGQFERFDIARQYYNTCITTKKVTEYTYSKMLNVLAEEGNLALAENIFRDAIEASKSNEKLVNAYTYNSVIKAAGKSRSLKKAKEYYDKAIKDNKADAHTYTNMMDAAAKENDLELAENIFGDAIKASEKDRTLLNSTTYSNMIDIYLKNEHPKEKEAEERFKQAVSNGLGSISTYNIYCNYLFKQKKYDEAEKVFDKFDAKAYLAPKTQYDSFKKQYFDFHGLSMATAILLMKKNPMQFTFKHGDSINVIIGKSKGDDARDLKQAFTDLVEKYNVGTMKTDLKNEGRLSFTFNGQPLSWNTVNVNKPPIDVPLNESSNKTKRKPEDIKHSDNSRGTNSKKNENGPILLSEFRYSKCNEYRNTTKEKSMDTSNNEEEEKQKGLKQWK